MMRYAACFKTHPETQVKLDKGRRLLGLGCGTATLTISIEKTFPEAEVVRIGGDLETRDCAKVSLVRFLF
ncbi:hypothetical protein A3K79_04855 [Candidatus Bathyarchaeota archaeon RBG_13_46_16b]|nr:MAG: hypothetical protein A3K79_04855 [Candidatus Bathyarchaeota archaeon RBG_13_46_16b]